MTEQFCPKCKLTGRESIMRVAHQGRDQILYKCPYPDCGHMTFVQELEEDSTIEKRKASER